MSRVRTKPTESATRRDFREGRTTRAEMLPMGPLLEYRRHGGGALKWPTLFYGGETTAGE